MNHKHNHNQKNGMGMDAEMDHSEHQNHSEHQGYSPEGKQVSNGAGKHSGHSTAMFAKIYNKDINYFI